MVYSFSLRNGDGSDREDTGCMWLRDDFEARAFGVAVIRDMLRDNAMSYSGWTMDVVADERAVCCIPVVSISGPLANGL
jgi:hypothetical protein